MPEILVIIACLALGAGLIVLEALTPGLSLPGLAGAALLGVGTWLMWKNYGQTGGLITLLAALVFTSGAVVLSLKSASSGRLSKSRIILGKSTPVPELDSEESLVGLTGEALTPLTPVGEAMIGGRRLDVLSEGGYIPKGTRLCVLRTEGKKIIVRPEGSEQ
ncbi:MAG: hypothetical protein K5663_04040 [Clostridiales bacterium]|nr:hypothetical protein [Clostridiales bacterium]